MEKETKAKYMRRYRARKSLLDKGLEVPPELQIQKDKLKQAPKPDKANKPNKPSISSKPNKPKKPTKTSK
jgi:hypothetical protein